MTREEGAAGKKPFGLVSASGTHIAPSEDMPDERDDDDEGGDGEPWDEPDRAIWTLTRRGSSNEQP